MRYLIAVFIPILLIGCGSSAEPLPEEKEPTVYFPPTNSDAWETIDIASLGWDASVVPTLDDFVETTNTRALLILKSGRIVYEKYDGQTLLQTADFTEDSYWYWASAAKTLTSFLIGRAESQNLLSLDDPSNLYLGSGWTSLTSEQEGLITIRNQLTMTTGLDYTVTNPDCFDSDCLQFLDVPGNRWFYHNGPYTLLGDVIEGASGSTFNAYFAAQLANKIGMDGFWEYNGYNHAFYSPARSMARFGLLILAEGKWDGTDVLANDSFYREMSNTSQNLNPSYGYLWWLNGKGSFIPPGLTASIPGDITPTAPDEMFAAMGKNGQLINIVPSQQLVIIRMGDDPDEGLVPFTFQDALWDLLGDLITE
ncbi:MAG: serine hydrolase [Ekhidna sp.]